MINEAGHLECISVLHFVRLGTTQQQWINALHITRTPIFRYVSLSITNTPQAQLINGDSGLNQRTRCSRRISARTARDSDDDDDVQVTYIRRRKNGNLYRIFSITFRTFVR